MITTRRLLAVAGLCSLIACPLPVGAQAGTASITGMVTSSDSGTGVAGALVQVLGTNQAVRTTPSGRFALTALAPGTVVLTVRRLGYRPLELEIDLFPNEHFLIEPGTIVLTPVPVLLPGAVVEGTADMLLASLERAGFYERRAAGFGAFVDRAQLDQWNPGVVTDVLRRVPGVRIRPNPNYGRRLNRFVPVDGRRFLVELTRNALQNCDPLLFLDGLYIGTLGVFDIDVLVADEELAGVEVYRGASEVPARFHLRGSTCGVLVLWTR